MSLADKIYLLQSPDMETQEYRMTIDAPGYGISNFLPCSFTCRSNCRRVAVRKLGKGII